MELLTISILTLLALYVIYSEPFKLPAIVKKNKQLVYILIIGLYLYYYQNNNVVGSVEGMGQKPSAGHKPSAGQQPSAGERATAGIFAVLLFLSAIAVCCAPMLNSPSRRF